jgi:hypothetical protein
VNPHCRAISLSMSNLLERVRRTGSEYVMIPGYYYDYPGLLDLPASLDQSGAFKVLHTELGPEGRSDAGRGFVLPRSTGWAPKAVPTLMDADTAVNLRRCEQAKRQGASEEGHLLEVGGYPARRGGGCGRVCRWSHKDIQREQGAHQQIRYIYRLADAQLDRHAAQRVGLLATETPCLEVIYHVE